MLHRLSLLAFILVAPLLVAQTEIQIPDQNLATFLLDKLDVNTNGRIEQSEALELKELTLRNGGVTDLSGLEGFTNLEQIDLSGNRITDVTPLAQLPHLALISLRNNGIADLSPLLEKDVLLATGTLSQRPLIDIEGNFLSKGDCSDLIGIGNRGFRAVYGDQETGALDCVEVTAVSATRWVPHITAASSDFDTTVMLSNGGEAGLLTLRPYSADGTLLGEANLIIPADSVLNLDSAALFDDAAISHFAVSGCETCAVTIGYRAGDVANSGTAHVNETRNLGRALTAFAGEREVVFDGASIVNAGLDATEVTVRALDASGTELGKPAVIKALAPNAKALIVFDTLFPNLTPDRYTLTSTEPVAALFLRGSHVDTGASILYHTDERLGLPVANNAKRHIPHLTRPGAGFSTHLMVVNESEAEGSVDLQPYTEDGVAMEPIHIAMKPGSTLLEDATTLVGDAAHVAITGDDYVTVVVTYKATTKDSATAHVREQTEPGTHFRVFTGEWSTVWDGAAMVNMGEVPAEIVATAYDAEGSQIFQTVLDEGLVPHGKLLVDFASLLPEQTARVDIQASQSITTAFLRGSTVGKTQLLFQTDPLSREND
jgi:hypothetical protein